MTSGETVGEAERLMKEARVQEALSLLDGLSEQNARSLRVRMHCSRMLADLETAAEEGKRLLQLSDHPGDQLSQAITLMELHRFPEAAACLGKLMKTLNEANRAYFVDTVALMFSYCLVMVGKLEEASETLGQVGDDPDADIFWIDNVPLLSRSSIKAMIGPVSAFLRAGPCNWTASASRT